MVDEVESPRRQVAVTMAEAARTWLESLNAEQRETAVGHLPSDDETDGERRRWFYTPTDHGGLAHPPEEPPERARRDEDGDDLQQEHAQRVPKVLGQDLRRRPARVRPRHVTGPPRSNSTNSSSFSSNNWLYWDSS